ncbi:Endonuclease/exonuclease/phosphatase [Suillus subalutaceus]|uniref:Endonuclease/exonuclease/phosphatase n=1 Tax=Suillus subalutaceus TaxID=48586 RepID=UPI001B8615D5|nr:Endonuclease/exonuclease/phosphatase [Suillus subalutaceus]KAG1829529.1 Endonuclease/exonuclease/phosphatase [Suillus subalutaceus]
MQSDTEKEKKTRANIKLATLNMKGRTSSNLEQSQISKWTVVNQTMRDQKIGILCLQETHLTTDHLNQVENIFLRRLKILSTSDPMRPGSSAGIAFVLNKEITNTADTLIKILIPGRAAVLSTKWHNNETINILNIYAPNNANEHHDFWKKIETEWLGANLGPLDFMMGDFNLTENPIDRAPAQLDNENAISALRDLRSTLRVQDTWRDEHPHQRMFTFSSNHHTLSRIDRIYASERHTESLVEWNSGISQIPTDHHMVSVRLAPPNLPHIGKGRWSWPVGIISDIDLNKKIIESDIEAQRRIEEMGPRTETTNPQTIWKTFKDNLTILAKDTTKTHLAKINQRIKTLTKDLRKITNCKENTLEDTRMNRIILEKEIEHLHKKRYKESHLRAQVKWATHGETISKYWSKINSQKAPRDGPNDTRQSQKKWQR